MVGQRIKWIDGIKLMACIGVFLSHYTEVFITYSVVGLNQTTYMLSFLLKITRLFYNGNFWVCIFCIISGYLANQKRINTPKEFFTSILIRYIRFVIPITFVVALVWLLSITIGFQTNKYGTILQNSYLASFYKDGITPLKTFKSIFTFSSVLDGPLWTIRCLFLGNCSIYFFSYLMKKLKTCTCNIFYIFLFLICIALSRWKEEVFYIGVCFLGTMLPSLWEYFSTKMRKVQWVIFVLLVVSASGIHNVIINGVSTIIKLPVLFQLSPYWNALYALLLLIFLNGIPIIKRFFACDVLQKCKDFSFPIYLCHWPLICTFSLWFYGVIIHWGPYYCRIVAVLFVTLSIIIALSFLYLLTFERISTRLIKNLNRALLGKR